MQPKSNFQFAHFNVEHSESFIGVLSLSKFRELTSAPFKCIIDRSTAPVDDAHLADVHVNG